MTELEITYSTLARSDFPHPPAVVVIQQGLRTAVYPAKETNPMQEILEAIFQFNFERGKNENIEK
jgi:hypothetical protein